MSQDFILICGEEGGEPCEVIKRVFHWLTRNPIICVQPPGTSGAGRVGGVGQHPGAVSWNHRDQVSQPCDSGFLKILQYLYLYDGNIDEV